MAIERTHHQDKAITLLPREHKRLLTKAGCPAFHAAPELQCHPGAYWQVVVEWQDDRKRSLLGTPVQQKAKIAVLVANDQMPRVRKRLLGSDVTELGNVKVPGIGKALRRRREQHDCRQNFRSPEHCGLVGAKLWISRETTAPNAGRGLRSQRPQNPRRRRLLARWLRSPPDRQDCAEEIPTQIQDGSSGANSLVLEIASPKQWSCRAPTHYKRLWSPNQCGGFRDVKERAGVAFWASGDAQPATPEAGKIAIRK